MRRIGAATLLCVFSFTAVMAQTAQSQSLDLVLPTDNDALFSGDGAAFYQYVERDFNGVKARPWQGGQYGFVRDPTQTPGGVVYTRFHEGIDIRPLHRDPAGEPLDEVRAIADGKVMHVNPVPGYSNYGKYVVIEHRWDGSNYYSLYAHLSSIRVHPGDSVTRGQPIAIMGHTGDAASLGHGHIEIGFSDSAGDPLNHHGAAAWTPSGAAMRRVLVALAAGFHIKVR